MGRDPVCSDRVVKTNGGGGSCGPIWFLPLLFSRVDFGQTIPFFCWVRNREGAGVWGKRLRTESSPSVILNFQLLLRKMERITLPSRPHGVVLSVSITWALVTSACPQVWPWTCCIRVSESEALGKLLRKLLEQSLQRFSCPLCRGTLVHSTWLLGDVDQGQYGKHPCTLKDILKPLVFRKWVKCPGSDKPHPKLLTRLQMRAAKCCQLAEHDLKRATWILSSLTRWEGRRRKLKETVGVARPVLFLSRPLHANTFLLLFSRCNK